MSTHYSPNGNGDATAPASSPEWQPESPFAPAPVQESGVATIAATAPTTAFGSFGTESPFRAEFDGEPADLGPQAEHLASLLGELYDQEFEEALIALAEDGAAVVASRERLETDDPELEQELSEQALREHYAPLLREATAMLDRMNAELGEIDLATVGEDELEARLDGFVRPSAADSSEMFEQFFGALFKKARSAFNVARKAVTAGVKLVGRFMPIALVIDKIKGYLPALVERVLQIAQRRMPSGLRPIVAQLAHRYFGVKLPGAAPDAPAAPSAPAALGAPAPADAAAGAPVPEPTAADAAEIQQEFDSLLAGSLIGGKAFEAEAAMESLMHAPHGHHHHHHNARRKLRHARRRFARRMVSMQRHEDPTPEVENFLPALIAAAKIGIAIGGRDKLVKLLSSPVANFAAKYIGAEPAKAISQALVDVGLRLIHLEASEEQEQLAAGYALASTVENTVNHLLASAPASAWNDELLMESYLMEAFEKAAAASFPDSYIRPELRESVAFPGAWIPVPGPESYEKYSVMPEVTITPRMARDVRVFGGDSLTSVLRARHGLPADGTLTARIHLYRAVAGTTLAGIAASERVRGLGPEKRDGSSLLHPLTTDAARVLLGEPGLGYDADPRFLVRPEVITPLQRFYYLELRGVEGELGTDEMGRRKRARASHVRVVFNFPANELVVRSYHYEPDAQELAARLRTGKDSRGLLILLRPVLERRLKRILSGRPTNRVRVVHEATVEQHELPAAFAQVLSVAGARIVELVIGWTMGALRKEAEGRGDDFRKAFIEAADAPANGVTLTFRIRQPAFLPVLRRVVASPSLAALSAVPIAGGADGVHLDIRPGFVTR